MTYPQQYPPQGYAPPVAPQYPPQPQYAPAQPQYAPPMPQYPPQGYPQQYAAPAAAPVPQLPASTLSDFYDQPSSAGPSWKFKDKPIGTAYAGLVARDIKDSDIQVVTDPRTNQPVYYKDGRPKLQMIVPMMFQPTAEHPDGQAGWYVKGQARDELARAMAEAGAPAGTPERGAYIHVQLVGHRQTPLGPAYQYRVTYQRPQGAHAVPAAPAATPLGGPVEQYNNPSAPMQEYAFVQQAQAPMPQGVQVAPIAQPLPQPVPQAVPAQVSPQPTMAAPATPVAGPQVPPGMDANQAALWAQLTGGQPIPQAIPQG